jgi:rubrerythrin
MPTIAVKETGYFQIRSDDFHWDNVSSSLIQVEACTDVMIHCKNKMTLKANTLKLAQCSKLLRRIFNQNSRYCSISDFIPLSYNLVCPDFDPKAMQIILDLIYTGQSKINIADSKLLSEIKSILKNLQMDVLSSVFEIDYSSKSETTSSKQRTEIETSELLEQISNVADSLINSHSGPIEKTKNKEESKRERNNSIKLSIVEKERTRKGFLSVEVIQQHISQSTEKQDASSHSRVPNSVKEELVVKNIWACSLCNQVFDNEDLLLVHLTNSHSYQIPVTSDDQMTPNRNQIGQRQFECPICHAKQRFKSNLYTHIGVKHFKKEIQALYGPNKWDCSLCSKKFQRQAILITHLVNHHRALAKFLPDFFGKSTSLVKTVKIKSKSVNKKLQRSKSSIKKFICHVCSRPTPTLKNLLCHYALSHYHRKLKKKFGNAKNCCDFCTKTFMSSNGLLRHVACKHNALSDFMTENQLKGIVNPDKAGSEK